MTVQLSEEWVGFLESGVSMLVGSRDAALHPGCTRALGVRVGADRRTLTLFLNAGPTERMQADFGDNGRVAATFSRPVDHRTIQVKGRVLVVWPTTESDRSIQERYLSAFAEQVAIVGLPRSIVRRIRLTPRGQVPRRGSWDRRKGGAPCNAIVMPVRKPSRASPHPEQITPVARRSRAQTAQRTAQLEPAGDRMDSLGISAWSAWSGG